MANAQHIPAQRIVCGPLSVTLDGLTLGDPTMVVGSSRSVALVLAAGLDATEIFDASCPHNPASVVSAARAQADAVRPQTVIAVGSASAIDLGKAVVEHHRAMLVAVPTTLGGSEMSRVYGSRRPDGVKAGGGGKDLLPRIVCYDPDSLASLSADLLVASGANAWAHALEGHYARREHWIGRACATAAGRALPSLLGRADEVPNDVELRRHLFQAACQAGFALNACGMGLHHAICHVLGGLTGVGHALLNFVMLPASIEVNMRRAPGPVGSALAEMDNPDVSEILGSLAARFQIPRTLQELGVKPDQLDRAVPEVMAAHHLKNNPGPIDESDVKEALKAAYDGSAIPN